jgi:uncharacterized protein (DUF1330 family)
MAAYVIAEVVVTDPVRFERYKEAVPATIAAHGGRYLVRGGSVDPVEGTWQPKRLVVVEFESPQRARGWLESPEYQEVKRLRQGAAQFQVVIVEGFPG